MADDPHELRRALAATLADLDDLIRVGIRRLGLDDRERRILEALAAAGAETQRSIGEALGIDRTTMVALIDRLEHEGLVRRDARPEDRRAHAVALTDKGRRLQRRAVGAVADAEHALLERLAPHDRARARRLLRRLATPE